MKYNEVQKVKDLENRQLCNTLQLFMFVLRYVSELFLLVRMLESLQIFDCPC